MRSRALSSKQGRPLSKIAESREQSGRSRPGTKQIAKKQVSCLSIKQLVGVPFCLRKYTDKPRKISYLNLITVFECPSNLVKETNLYHSF